MTLSTWSSLLGPSQQTTDTCPSRPLPGPCQVPLRPGVPLVACLLLVAMLGAFRSFLLLVISKARSAPSSVLAPSSEGAPRSFLLLVISKARSAPSSILAPSSDARSP